MVLHHLTLSKSTIYWVVGNAAYGPYYTNDPLWDGEGCGDDCCSDVAMPWFLRHFPAAAKEGVEVRIYHDQLTSDEDIVIDLLQLFVQ